MPESESIRAEAARRGVSQYRVRQDRLEASQRARGQEPPTFRQRRSERHAQQMLRGKRERAEFAHLPQPVEAAWDRQTDFPLTTEESPHGMQGPFYGAAQDPDWEPYEPTRTLFPDRPRTLQARYSQRRRRLEVVFRDGTTWHYSGVPAGIWTRFKRTESPGRYINNVLNGYDYGRGGFGIQGDNQ